MWRFQVHFWLCGLLLLTSVILTIRFHCSKIPAQRIYYITWSHLWLLSKISLWIEFYRTVLGHCQIPLPLKPQNLRYGCHGKKCDCLSWCCTTASNSLVGTLILLIYMSSAYFVADLQISQADLFLPMHKACLALRLCGPTVDIMGIVPFPQTWYKRQNLLTSSVIANYNIDPIFIVILHLF